MDIEKNENDKYQKIFIINKRMSQELVEDLADEIHNVWSRLYKHFRLTWDDDSNHERWRIQSNTDFVNLSEEDKAKDRLIVQRLLEIFGKH